MGYNKSSPLNNYNFIYANCLELIRLDEDCPYELQVPMTFLYAMLTIGMFNNWMSLMVFYDRKYTKKTLSLLKLLRYYYVCNITVAVTLILNIASQIYFPVISHTWTLVEGMNRTLSLLYQAFQKLSVAILSYITVLRCIHSVAPYFVSFSPKADVMSRLILMIMGCICFALHFRSLLASYDLMDATEVVPTIIFYAINLVVVVGANIAWLAIEKYRSQQLSDKLSSVVVRKLFHYAFMSCALFIVTTVPVLFYLMVPSTEKNEYLIACKACQDRIGFADYLLFTMYTGCFFDNMLYLIQSDQYRQDVVWHFKTAFRMKRDYVSDYFRKSSSWTKSTASRIKASVGARALSDTRKSNNKTNTTAQQHQKDSTKL